MFDATISKPGNMVSYTATIGVGAVEIAQAPAHTVVEVDEISITDLSGNPNNVLTIFDQFNLATDGTTVQNAKGTYVVPVANDTILIQNINGFKFLHSLRGQASLGNMRVTIRGREL